MLLTIVGVLSGCNSDEENLPIDLKVKEITIVDDELAALDVPVFTYENGLLTSYHLQNGVSANFVYDGQNLVHWENNSDMGYSHDISYENGWPALITSTNGFGDVTTSEITYNAGELATAGQTEFYWANGNLTKKVFSSGRTFEFTYGPQFNPFRSMPITWKNHGCSEFWGLMTQSENVCLSKKVYNTASQELLPQYSYTFEMVYNDDNYPTQIKARRMSDNVIAITYTIEYQ
ncbi:hypothetical protein [Flavobacterium longum]|uniref:hypothetical protein n=1 Tax=Flavobacterium longum TaxID=1299340 RepID=UPI0039E83608